MSYAPPEIYDQLAKVLADEGPAAAAERLCAELRAAGDFQNLFYALLLRERVRLGVSPFPAGPADDLPPEAHEPYEVAIREAAREVGGLFLARGNIPQAWPFYRLIGEPQPIREAIADYRPGPEEDPYPVVEIAWHQSVAPERGFDLVLDRAGVCSAITLVSSTDLSRYPDLRDYCVRRLVRALYDQLLERLRADRAAGGKEPPPTASVAELTADLGDSLAEGGYHVDVSHLSSVAQMALQLPYCEEIGLARELCAYGAKLHESLRGRDDPPFENTYSDYGRYLDAVAGVDVESAVSHFVGKLPTAAVEGYRYPAQVAINLLVRLGRTSEALAIARQYLAAEDQRTLSCPGVGELARRAGDFQALAEFARRQADPVSFLGAMLASRD